MEWGFIPAPAHVRQVYTSETTQRDYQHNNAQGRQIIYGGYYNANCDYVYMNYTYTGNLPGGNKRHQCAFAIYDWSYNDWNYDGGGIAYVGLENSRYVNMSATPDNGWPVVNYHHSADAVSNIWSLVGYSADCPNYIFTLSDTLEGPPNLQNIQTGICGDPVQNPNSAYIWPKIDMQLNSGGHVVTHAAGYEYANCANIPDNGIETSSLVYYRKVETVANEPWTGTWEGPHFIDSTYLISNLVVADKNGPNVYYVYLKPLYWYYGNQHPCNGDGWYQLLNDVVYQKSTDYGATWDGTIYNITDHLSTYEAGGTDPAYYDLSSFVDPDGNLHAVWVSSNADTACTLPYAMSMWHWDSGNDCISLAYDASQPSLWDTRGMLGHFNTVVTNSNISWCDDKLYISFQRFGTHPVVDTPSINREMGAGSIYQESRYFLSDIMVIGSDAVSGSMGKTWTEAINLTDTESDSCLPGECDAETYPTMAMYSTDSLMIEYINDRDPGAAMYIEPEGIATENPVMFLTWPCFSMAEMGTNYCYATTLPIINDSIVWQEVPLAPHGNISGCNTPATYEDEIELRNCGNADLSYTLSSNAGWLTHTSPTPISAGTGPRGSDNVSWTGASGCASPSTVAWTANSASLSQGNYKGIITVGMSDGAGDFYLVVNAVVTCEYYLPEYATITSGCWDVDLWNTPQANNMLFHHCYGDSSHQPLCTEAVILGWKDGSDIYCFTDNSDDHMIDLLPPIPHAFNARMRALNNITVDSVGIPSYGIGYTHTQGYFCTPDSSVYGSIEYYIPGHQDTAVIIEKLTIWNESGTALSDFVIGEGIDWDMERDSNFDGCGIDYTRQAIYQYGAGSDNYFYAGLMVKSGDDGNLGAAVLANQDWIYPDTGFNIIDIYNKLTVMDGLFSIFNDSSTDLTSVYRFWEGTLGVNDTIEICKIKAASLDGLEGLREKLDKGSYFIDNYELCQQPQECQGMCGDANNDGVVDISDIYYTYNYWACGGFAPQPVLACSNANSDYIINVSDIVYLINFVLSGGNPPGDCHPGIWSEYGGDCCPYSTPKADLEYPPRDSKASGTISVSNVQIMSNSGSAVTVGVPITFSSSVNIISGSAGLYHSAGDVALDSISCDLAAINSNLMCSNNLDPGNKRALLSISMDPLSADCSSITAGTYNWGKLWFTVAAGAPSQVIAIDSGFIPPAGYTTLTDEYGNSFAPDFNSGSITIISDELPDSIDTDPVFLISPGGHVPFRVYMFDGFGDPIEGDSTVYVVLDDCDEFIRCPEANSSDTIYPETPSDEQGIVVFYIDGGNCDNDCTARVMRGQELIAEVPVKMFDIDGDLVVSYETDYDYTLCNDYTGNDKLDFNDQILWEAQIGDSCAMSSCDRFISSFRTIPGVNLVAGQLVKLELALANNNEDSCYIGLITFFMSGFGTEGDPINIGSYSYNDFLGAGEKDTISEYGNIPGVGDGKMMVRFNTLCCDDVIQLDRNYKADSACVLDVNKCFVFKMNLTDLPIYSIDTAIYRQNQYWNVYFTHFPATPLSTPDSIVYEICTPDLLDHGDSTSVLISICYDSPCIQPQLYESYVLTPSSSGDCNHDCRINVSDAVYVINYVFSGGNAPNPCVQGDVNCDSKVNVSDAVYIINFVFSGGKPPCNVGTVPEPTCGKSSTIGKWY